MGNHCWLSCTCRFDLANFNGLLQGHVDHEGVHRWLCAQHHHLQCLSAAETAHPRQTCSSPAKAPLVAIRLVGASAAGPFLTLLLLRCRGEAFSCLCTGIGRQRDHCWHCCQSHSCSRIFPGRPPSAEDSPVQSPPAGRLCRPQHVARATEGSGDGMQQVLPVWLRLRACPPGSSFYQERHQLEEKNTLQWQRLLHDKEHAWRSSVCPTDA